LQMQMDPHFIHGTMTVLQNLILEGDTDRASDYVATFTKHMRSLLFNNNLTDIPFIEELNLVRGYIVLEETRFASALSWEIIGIEDSPEWLQNGVPPFIMQPFVENAIRHGLRPLLQKPHEYTRLAQLTIRVECLPSQRAVNCIIEDNGVGRVVAAQYKKRLAERGMNNNLSISTVSVTERLHLLEEMYGLPVNVEYEDVVEPVEEYLVESAYSGNTLSNTSTTQFSTTQRVCGTRVKITIPFVRTAQ
jgi:LytS/YehU family sensor histidine kinase